MKDIVLMSKFWRLGKKDVFEPLKKKIPKKG